MKSIILISLNFVLSILMITMIDWFEKEEQKIKTIIIEYDQNVQKLEKISQINPWLNEIIKVLEKKEKNTIKTDESLISFFDENKDAYNLLVSKYIYEDEISKNLDLSYDVGTDNRKNLAEFMVIENKDGFLQFRELKMNKQSLNGKIQVIHFNKLYNGDKNVSKH